MGNPSLNGSNGRAKGGKFARGNREGKGNPMARYVNRLRVALLRAVTPEDITKIVATMIKEAKDGNVMAAKEIMDRTMGKSAQPVEHSGPDGAPLNHGGDIDLTKLSFEELDYLQTLRAELAKRGGGDNEKEDHASNESRSEEGPTS